jgi:hypothetical protein
MCGNSPRRSAVPAGWGGQWVPSSELGCEVDPGPGLLLSDYDGSCPRFSADYAEWVRDPVRSASGGMAGRALGSHHQERSSEADWS